MAQQQQDGRSRQMIVVAIVWVLSFLLLQRFAPRAPAGPAQTQSILQQAKQLDTEGRTSTTLSEAEKQKRLEQAVGKYEEFYKANEKTQEGMQARFSEINIYDYLGVKTGNGHWYDQAEQKLKEMETGFHGRQGTVQLEVQGAPVTKTGDLGQIASERLGEMQKNRDALNSRWWGYQILNACVQLFGGQRNPYSYFLALLMLVVVLKGVTWPFQKKQYQYQRDMMRIQPLVKEMQEKMKGRPQEEINKRMFEIYRENNVSLTAGCLPMLVMVVALWPVYYFVRSYEYQFTWGHFLWIGSGLSHQYPWIADNLMQFDVPLFVIYLISTVAFSFMQPKPADPQQAQQQKMMVVMMPLIFGVMMWMYRWSSAFMLYWLVLNFVSMYQSWRLNKEFGLSPTGEAGSGGGGGGGSSAPENPPPPLAPMKGAHNRQVKNGKNGKNGNGRTPGALPDPARIRPRGSGRGK